MSVILEHSFEDGTKLKLTQGTDRCALRCVDGTTSDWTEYYKDLSTALARVAALVYCAEREWEPAFVTDSVQFGTTAQEFFTEVSR